MGTRLVLHLIVPWHVCSKLFLLKSIGGPGKSCSILLKIARNTKKSIGTVGPGESCSILLKIAQNCSKWPAILKKVLVGPGKSCSILLKIAQFCSKLLRILKYVLGPWQILLNFAQFCSKCHFFSLFCHFTVVICSEHVMMKVKEKQKMMTSLGCGNPLWIWFCLPTIILFTVDQCFALLISVSKTTQFCSNLLSKVQKNEKNNKTKWRNKSVGCCCGLLCILECDCAFPHSNVHSCEKYSKV